MKISLLKNHFQIKTSKRKFFVKYERLCQIFLILWLSMLKYATTLASSLNKKLNGQHFFLPFKVANDIVKSTNNNLNQPQTKTNSRKQGHMKWYNHV